MTVVGGRWRERGDGRRCHTRSCGGNHCSSSFIRASSRAVAGSSSTCRRAIGGSRCARASRPRGRPPKSRRARSAGCERSRPGDAADRQARVRGKHGQRTGQQCRAKPVPAPVRCDRDVPGDDHEGRAGGDVGVQLRMEPAVVGARAVSAMNSSAQSPSVIESSRLRSAVKSAITSRMSPTWRSATGHASSAISAETDRCSGWWWSSSICHHSRRCASVSSIARGVTGRPAITVETSRTEPRSLRLTDRIILATFTAI